jgi:hypothetical protein
MPSWPVRPNDAFGVRILDPSYRRRSRDEPEVRGRCEAKSRAIPIGRRRHEQPPHPSLSPWQAWQGERIEKGWRVEAEPYPELGDGVVPDRNCSRPPLSRSCPSPASLRSRALHQAGWGPSSLPMPVSRAQSAARYMASRCRRDCCLVQARMLNDKVLRQDT